MTIALAFKDVIGLAYNCWQLKNRLDSLKHVWSIWYQLLQGSTGLGWYLVKMTINMPEEWWTRKFKEIPRPKNSKIRVLLYLMINTSFFKVVWLQVNELDLQARAKCHQTSRTTTGKMRQLFKPRQI